MFSAQAPPALAGQLVVVGVPKEVAMVGTPVSVKSVGAPLVEEFVVVQSLPQPLQEPKLGALTVQLLAPEPEEVQELLAVWVVAEVAV
jgi:hypothetical protein